MLTSGTGTDPSQPTAAASGTLEGGDSGVCLFEQPMNIVNQRDVSSVIKVEFADFGVGIFGGAIGSDGCKMCVKKQLQCTIKSHCKSVAVFVPKHISSSNVYVLITVSGQMKNQVWLTTSARVEKVGEQFEQAWKNDFNYTGRKF